MKRDMDLVRSLLFEIEKQDDAKGEWLKLEIDGVDREALIQHLFLMNEAGLVHGNDVSSIGHRDFKVRRLSWAGHDFLDAVRDDNIWMKTKAGAKKSGTAGIEFMWELAKAYGKEAIKEKLGLDLG